MIATSVAYDLVFLLHIISAITVVVVFVTMRVAALSVAQGADPEIQARRLPQRRNWAARSLHLMPVTGLVMALSGGASVALSQPWVIVGIVCYLAAAGHLEARTLPEERSVAAVIAREGSAPTSSGRALVRSVDVLLMLVAIALVSMVVQY